MTRSVNQAEYEALAAFRYALRQFLHFSETAAEEVGLTPQQHQALLAIKGFPSGAPITVGELAKRLQIRHHSAVGLVDRLAMQKLVTRQAVEDDRRQVVVALTERGEQLLEKLTVAHREELRRIGPNLNQLLAQLSGTEQTSGH